MNEQTISKELLEAIEAPQYGEDMWLGEEFDVNDYLARNGYVEGY